MANRFDRFLEKLYAKQSKPNDRKKICCIQAIALAMTGLGIWVGYSFISGNGKMLVKRVSKVEHLAETHIPSSSDTRNEQLSMRTGEIIEIMFEYRGKECQEAKEVFQEVKAILVSGVTNKHNGQPQTGLEKIKQIAKRNILIDNPFVGNNQFVWIWMAVALIYVGITLYTYRMGLLVETGESMFNILDASFFSILIGYTGGMHSDGRYLLLISVALAAFALHNGLLKVKKKKQSNTQPDQPLSCFPPIMKCIAYGWALLLTYFFATYNGFRVGTYLKSLTGHAVVALVIGFLAFIIMVFMLASRELDES